MSYVVNLLLSIPCGGPKSVPFVAAALLPGIHAEVVARAAAPGEEFRYNRLAGWAEGLLEHLAAGRGFARWSKGGTFSWGVGGNYTDVAVFVEALRPFWQALLRCRGGEEQRDWDGPFSVSQILLLCEGENDDHGYAVTIRNADPWRLNRHPDLAIDQHVLPFALYSAKTPSTPGS